MKEVPTFKMISQSVLIDRMKINGSLARVAIKHLEKEGLIKPLVHHRAQLVSSHHALVDSLGRHTNSLPRVAQIYTRATTEAVAE